MLLNSMTERLETDTDTQVDLKASAEGRLAGAERATRLVGADRASRLRLTLSMRTHVGEMILRRWLARRGHDNTGHDRIRTGLDE